MRSLKHSSFTSAPFRLEWRPSRWLIGSLSLLSVAAPLAILASAMPPLFAVPAAVVALAYGAGLIRREARRPCCEFVFGDACAPVRLDGRPLHALQVSWRGPLAFLRWRDASGRWQRLAWWPDTLPASARRELRLVAEVRELSRPPPGMAP